MPDWTCCIVISSKVETGTATKWRFLIEERAAANCVECVSSANYILTTVNLKSSTKRLIVCGVQKYHARVLIHQHLTETNFRAFDRLQMLSTVL